MTAPAPTPKFVFVTGGVVSSVGKGVTAAALGALLEARGLRVSFLKIDGYLSLDAGTLNPFEHGECYVLDDGAETDLDLGHYSRFTNCRLGRQNSITSGQVYGAVLAKERAGDYLGSTVQIVPHLTTEIVNRVKGVAGIAGAPTPDVVIVELGGTVGDIETLPFVEAIRQLIEGEPPGSALVLHVVYIPFLKAAQEAKSKPAQQSAAKLRELGLMTDVLVCRCEQPLDDAIRRKLSLFCSVPRDCVVEELDVQTSIYELPVELNRQGLDRLVVAKLGLGGADEASGGRDPRPPSPDLSRWERIVESLRYPARAVSVAVVGKYLANHDAYKSVFEALVHAGIAHGCRVDIVKVDAERLAEGNLGGQLGGCAGVLIPGGFGARGVEGMVLAAGYARTAGVPFLGICLGLQVAVIEFARSVAGLAGANSAEFVEVGAGPLVIDLMEAQRGVELKGGTMRTGGFNARLREGTLAMEAYGSEHIRETHRHRYEVNNRYLGPLGAAGLVVSAVNEELGLVEMVEVVGHPWFVGTQAHPEFRSKITSPHPLFGAFVGAMVRRGGGARAEEA